MTTPVQSSTQTQPTVDQHIAAALAQAPDILRQREDAYRQRQAQQEAKEAATLRESWTAPLAALRQTLPEWLHQYIEEPTQEYERYVSTGDWSRLDYRYVRIVLPGLNPIAAWVSKRGSATYEALQSSLGRNEDDGNWYVGCRPQHSTREQYELDHCGEPDIAVALFQAHDAYLKHLDLQAEAKQRNAAEPAPAAEPQPEPADPIDQALSLLAKLSQCEPIKQVLGIKTYTEEYADERTIVLSSVGLAIAHHLSRLADAAEIRNNHLYF